MLYANKTDYEIEFGSDDIPSGEDKLERALERASRLADTYMRSSGLTVPIVDEKAIGDIKGSILDLARYFAWNDNQNDLLRKKYEDAIRFFESISTGKIRIISGTESTPKQGFTNLRIVRS